MCKQPPQLQFEFEEDELQDENPMLVFDLENEVPDIEVPVAALSDITESTASSPNFLEQSWEWVYADAYEAHSADAEHDNFAGLPGLPYIVQEAETYPQLDSRRYMVRLDLEIECRSARSQ